MPRFLTLDEAAAAVRVRPATIRTYIREGKLPAKKLPGGKNLLIDQADLLAMLEDARAGEEEESEA
jgi:excisionase family DNA binding protein